MGYLKICWNIKLTLTGFPLIYDAHIDWFHSSNSFTLSLMRKYFIQINSQDKVYFQTTTVKTLTTEHRLDKSGWTLHGNTFIATCCVGQLWKKLIHNEIVNWFQKNIAASSPVSLLQPDATALSPSSNILHPYTLEVALLIYNCLMVLPDC
jgi:hypothetical protein